MRTIVVSPSKTFKDAAIAATISIIVFIGIYILLLILALGLTAILGVAGLSFMILMVSRIHIWGAFIGIGLMSIGVVVLIFLIKLNYVYKFERCTKGGRMVSDFLLEVFLILSFL